MIKEKRIIWFLAGIGEDELRWQMLGFESAGMPLEIYKKQQGILPYYGERPLAMLTSKEREEWHKVTLKDGHMTRHDRPYDSSYDKTALFTFTVRISVGRKRSDVVVCDEGIAPAMSEEQNATDDPFAVDRKLTAKVNKADKTPSRLVVKKRSKHPLQRCVHDLLINRCAVTTFKRQ